MDSTSAEDSNSSSISANADVQHSVRLGDTFKAGKRGNNSTFHTLQYGFKPASLSAYGNLSKSSTSKGSSNSQLEIEFPSLAGNEKGQITYFRGPYQGAKEVECLFIFEGEEQGFVVEKLTGSVKGLKPHQGTKESAIQSHISHGNKSGLGVDPNAGSSESKKRSLGQGTEFSVKKDKQARLVNTHGVPTSSSGEMVSGTPTDESEDNLSGHAGKVVISGSGGGGIAAGSSSIASAGNESVHVASAAAKNEGVFSGSSSDSSSDSSSSSSESNSSSDEQIDNESNASKSNSQQNT